MSIRQVWLADTVCWTRFITRRGARRMLTRCGSMRTSWCSVKDGDFAGRVGTDDAVLPSGHSRIRGQRYLKPLRTETGSAGYKEENRHERLHAAEFTGYPGTILEYPSDTLKLHPVAKPQSLGPRYTAWNRDRIKPDQKLVRMTSARRDQLNPPVEWPDAKLHRTQPKKFLIHVIRVDFHKKTLKIA